MGDAILDDGGFGVGEGLDFLEGFGMEAPEIAGLEDLDRQASLDELDSTLTNKKDKDRKDEEMMDQATKDREIVEEISTIMGEGIEDNHKMDSEDEAEAVPEQTGFYFYVLHCAIWYHLVQLKKHEKHAWRSVTFIKVLGLSLHSSMDAFSRF